MPDDVLIPELRAHTEQLQQENIQLREYIAELERTQLVTLLREIAISANESPNFETAVESCLFQVANFASWPIGHCYMLSGDFNNFVSTQIWYCEDPSSFDELYTMTNEHPVGIEDPWLGEVLKVGDPIFLPDVRAMPTFWRAEALLNAGLISAYAFPLLVENHVVGVMEFFDYEFKEMEKQFHEVMEDVGRQIGIVYSREMTAAALREEKNRAEAANKAKSEFLANMSHELRTPMNAILGLSELLQDMSLDKEPAECIDAVQGSASGLLTLLNDILDFSKIEAGELTLEAHPFHLKSMLVEVVDLLNPLAKGKGLKLLLENEEIADVWVETDSARLRQILNNLIGNALKFTENGQVTLNVKENESDSDNLKIYSISVIDTGIGIAEEKLSDIFNKFTQADTSMTRKFGGTGLGLAITRQLVEMMGGSISVTSAEGAGATFKVELPMLVTNDHDEVAEEDQIHHNSNVVSAEESRVLVVDDHPINQMFAGKLLRKFGITKVDYADNGQVALDILSRNNYDLVLLDCQMPVMDGFETISNIRQREDNMTTHLPVVAMTAHAMKGDRERCLQLGMDEYISKPIHTGQFKKVVSKWIALAEPKTQIAKTVESVKDNPVDLNHLRSFTEGDVEHEKMLFDIFAENAELSIQVMEEHVAATEGDDWKHAVHKLKGAAGNLGATHLYRICRDAEPLQEEDPFKRPEALKEMRDEVVAVNNFLSAVHAEESE